MGIGNQVPLEKDEALILVAYLRRKGYKHHHSPNETGSSLEAQRRAIRMKQQGTSKGFPDYLVLKDHQLYAIELKRQHSSSPSPEQQGWLTALGDCGIPSIVAYGAQAAIDYLETAT